MSPGRLRLIEQFGRFVQPLLKPVGLRGHILRRVSKLHPELVPIRSHQLELIVGLLELAVGLLELVVGLIERLALGSIILPQEEERPQ